MKLKESVTIEKLRGGYYTPENLAKFIVDWGLGDDKNIKRILEPSCGDGVFLQCVTDIDNEYKCVAIELDRIESQKAENQVKGYENFEIINMDFYDFYKKHVHTDKFDLVIGNPPYIRYQYLTEEQRIVQSEILTNNGMKPNKLINSWVSFVVASIQFLDNDGKIGLVIPAELLQVAYAEQLRKFLMKELQKLTIITFKELVFPNVEQEVIILLGEKSRIHTSEHKIRILEVKNIQELFEIQGIFKNQYQNVEINDSKWTRYFLSESDNELIKTVKEDKRFLTFQDIAEVDIGITTGNNNFFCVNKDIVNEYKLEDVIRPLIARSVSIQGVHFTFDDWKFNIEKGAKAFLLDFPDIPYEEYSEGHKRYIQLGEKNGENTGYKCRIRNRWYRVPSIWVPDAFFLRRNYLYPKFVLNTNLQAVSTDTMHRVKFLPLIVQNPARVMVAYYNSITLAFTEIEGRSYGGGVLEILPGELEKIVLPDLTSESLISNEKINSLEIIIDDYVRNNDDIIELLDVVDKEILINILGIPEEVVMKFRNMWLILRNRRLLRGKKNKQ